MKAIVFIQNLTKIWIDTFIKSRNVHEVDRTRTAINVCKLASKTLPWTLWNFVLKSSSRLTNPIICTVCSENSLSAAVKWIIITWNIQSYPLLWLLIIYLVQQQWDFKLTLVFARTFWWCAAVCFYAYTGWYSSTCLRLYKPHGIFLQIRMGQSFDNSQKIYWALLAKYFNFSNLCQFFFSVHKLSSSFTKLLRCCFGNHCQRWLQSLRLPCVCATTNGRLSSFDRPPDSVLSVWSSSKIKLEVK